MNELAITIELNIFLAVLGRHNKHIDVHIIIDRRLLNLQLREDGAGRIVWLPAEELYDIAANIRQAKHTC